MRKLREKHEMGTVIWREKELSFSPVVFGDLAYVV